MSGKIKIWLEAMRLRTLPVSLAGVIYAGALGMLAWRFRLVPWLMCMLFALLAQIASNFANEYFDYRDGLDRKGRVGPRRGVTEGDISPRSMLAAALGSLGVAALLGLSLIYWGGWWLIAAGILIVAGALAYSTGPYPLSRHGWGEAAVIFFFGIAPVTLTYYVQTGVCTPQVWMAVVAIGLLGANVLIVNNYRDIDDDRAVGKLTLAVRFGAKFTRGLYLFNGLASWALLCAVWYKFSWGAIPSIFQLMSVITLRKQLGTLQGRALTALLARTALLMLLLSLAIVLLGAFHA